MIAGDSELLRCAIQNEVRTEHAYLVHDLPQDLFDEMIDSGIRAARAVGLAEPRDIAAFVLLMFEVGPEFHRHPAIRAVLEDPSVAAHEKLPALFRRVPDCIWEEIESTIAEQTWFPEPPPSSARL